MSVAFLEGACSVLEGCDIYGGRLHCFGGVWHFWRALEVFWRGVAFWWGACSVLKGRGTLEEEVLAVYWRGVAFLEALAVCH